MMNPHSDDGEDNELLSNCPELRVPEYLNVYEGDVHAE